MSDRKELQNRVIILNGYSDEEIGGIMRVVKAIYSDGTPEQALESIAAARQIPQTREVQSADLIFAKTTSNSLQMKLADLIVDMSEDHEYLRKNPPQAAKVTPPPDGAPS